jgi:hypothetical protein
MLSSNKNLWFKMSKLENEQMIVQMYLYVAFNFEWSYRFQKC